MASKPDRSASPTLPRRDIIAICAFLNRPEFDRNFNAFDDAECKLQRLAAAARMQ